MAIKYFIGLVIYALWIHNPDSPTSITLPWTSFSWVYISMLHQCCVIFRHCLLLGAYQKLYLQLKMSFYKVHDSTGWQLLIQMWNLHVFRIAADFSDNSFYFAPHTYHSKDRTLVYLTMYAQKSLFTNSKQLTAQTGLPANPPKLVIVYKWRQRTKNTRLSFYSWNSIFTYFI